jgi:hypothetical protein
MRARSKRLTLLFALVVTAAIGSAGVAYTNGGGSSGVRTGEGVGMYTDPSVANQASTFTINRSLVSCGVGTANAGGFVGVFEMLMFSTKIQSYAVNTATREITAKGEMRSITRVGGAVVEDVRHPFIAHALDLDGDEGMPRSDRFDVHMKSAFWQPGNPMCTPSDRYPGLCRFGGKLFAGNVNVSSNGCTVEGDDDNDGLNNANERLLGLLLNNADSDRDGIKDGNDDANRNGKADEDEDDGDECPDPDRDRDGVDDEDEDD